MLQLSQSKISTWETCQRKFQLRYIDRSDWPEPPHSADISAVMEQGEIFHMLAAQSYNLGDLFQFDAAELASPIDVWWQAFQQHRPIPKKGVQHRVESTLSATLTDQIKLVGRLDLLFLSEDRLEIFDWKTGKPRTHGDLKQDWQTRIYLALLYQSRALLGNESLSAEQLSITYWYTRDPQKSVKISYSEAWHAENWAELNALASQMGDRINSDQLNWPLTPHLKACSRCPFNILCGREPEEEVTEEPAFEILADDERIPAAPEIVIHPDI